MQWLIYWGILSINDILKIALSCVCHVSVAQCLPNNIVCLAWTFPRIQVDLRAWSPAFSYDRKCCVNIESLLSSQESFLVADLD